MNRDPHQALKSEIIAQARSSQVELILAIAVEQERNRL